jgi:RHS repeat-associated protein
LPIGAPSFDRGYSTGRLVGVTYGGTSAGTYRGYDQVGRVVRQYQRTDSVNCLIEASYYANGFVQNETYPAVPGAADRRVVSYTNDSAGKLSALSSAATSYAPAASVSSIGYGSHNGLKTETYGNSLIHSITYNNRLQPNEIKLGTSGAPTSIMGLVYNYGTTNNNGNVQSLGYSGGGLSYTQTFGYDALNRLTTSQENSGSNWSQTNAYDRYGNRWIDLGGGTQSLYFNTSNNRITGWSYDNAGNLLNDGYHSYSYDGENKISKVDGVSAYIYNGEGQRVRKLVGENTRFIYGIGGQLIAEFDGATGNLRKEYIYGGASLITIEPTAVNSNGTQYTTADNLGSPRVITKAGGIVASRHDYQPFGIELGAGVGGRTIGMGFSNSGDTNRKKFTQYERDNETGLDYAQARYYSSSEGRFTTADPLMASARPSAPQTWNRYSYGLNNPLKYTDPSGMNADDIGTAEDQRRQQQEQKRQQQQPTPAPTVVDVRKDKIITAEVDKIRRNSTPLSEGETAVLSDVRVVVGETASVDNGTVIDGYGNEGSGFTGVVRPIAYIPLDQNGNIIEGNGVAVQENVRVVSGERPDTTDKPAPTPKGGVFIDTQLLASGRPTTTIQQAVFVGQFPRSGGAATRLFRTAINEITKNANTRTVSVKIGTTQRLK